MSHSSKRSNRTVAPVSKTVVAAKVEKVIGSASKVDEAVKVPKLSPDAKTVAQNSKLAERILKDKQLALITPDPTKDEKAPKAAKAPKVLTPEEAKIAEAKRILREAQDEARAKKLASAGEIAKAKAEKEAAKKAKAEAKAKAKAEKEAAKLLKGKKETSSVVTRMEVVGIIFRENHPATTETPVLIELVDARYTLLTGKEGNLKESKTSVEKALHFLSGFTAVPVEEVPVEEVPVEEVPVA